MLKGRWIKDEETGQMCSIAVCKGRVGRGGLVFENVHAFWCENCAKRYGPRHVAIYDEDGELTIVTDQGVRPFEPTDDEV